MNNLGLITFRSSIQHFTRILRLFARFHVRWSDLAPPVGINLFLASQRFRQPVFAVFRAALPFLALMMAWLALLAYIPALSLWHQSGL
jgi:TRAP-type C4-dicarboxylate transport system permease large subunit